MALINFKLKHPDNIIPWGDAPDTSMHWYGLTDGEYWLDVNKATIYEYTSEVLAGSHANDSHYVDYQIARLLEDWTSIFDAIAEPVPDAFYAIARENNYLYRFYGAVQNWLENLPDTASTNTETYEHYDPAIEWIYSRTLTASHLTNDPAISFFRNNNNISIVWKADHLTEQNIPVWTAQNGELKIAYSTFIHEIEDFGNRFFNAMDTQVQIAIAKDWGTTQINKDALMREQQQRKGGFQQSLSVLKGEPAKHTDWDLINALITKMFS
jgi:hypothetical protein